MLLHCMGTEADKLSNLCKQKVSSYEAVKKMFIEYLGVKTNRVCASKFF